MTSTMHKSAMRSRLRFGQQGIATILIVLLTGLSLAVIVFGAFSHLGGLQRSSATMHGATQAQLRAWTTLEAARQYLAQIGGAEAAALDAGTNMGFEGELADSSAQITQVVKADASFCAGATRIHMLVGASGGPARSQVEAVLCVTTGGGGGANTLPSGQNYVKGPLIFSGDNKMVGNGDSKLVVDGSITGNGSITGYDSVAATGDVKLSGFSQIGALKSEGDMDVEGSFGSLAAMGTITLRGGDTTATTIITNQSVTDTNGGTYGAITAIGDVNLAAGSRVATVNTQASVFSSGTRVLTSLSAQGHFVETNCCSEVASGAVGGSVQLISARTWGPTVALSVVPALSVPITPVTPLKLAQPAVDANEYKVAANYVFDVDSSGRIVVTANSVPGLETGKTYYVTGSAGNQDYACPTSAYNATDCKVKICNGYSDYNSCFSYSNGSFSLNGPSSKTVLAPGTAWFHGHLNVGSGNYTNTFIASGDISTAGATFVTAPNYAGYEMFCQNPDFPSLGPANLCDGGSLIKLPLGDVAMLAGSYDSAGTFQGGMVSVGALNEIKGNIVAGDVIQTAGNTTIFGLVSASYQGKSGRNNVFGAKTTFNQQHLLNTPGAAPCPGCGTGAASTAQVLWARYQ